MTRWTEGDYNLWRLTHAHKTPVPARNVEPTAGNEPLAKKKAQGLGPPCRIHVHSRRYRLTDADGVSAKAAIDGLVHAGLLQDDSAKYVAEVSYSQEKISKKEEEETIIEITGGGNIWEK